MTKTAPEQHKGWTGVDLDGTLAQYDAWKGVEHIGDPVPAMLARVKKWLEEGREVRIFTARVYPLTAGEDINSALNPATIASLTERELGAWQSLGFIRAWCEKHLGRVLPITCRKDFNMAECWDDRAVGVMLNRGVSREDLLAYQMSEVMKAARVPVIHGQPYGDAARAACAKITGILLGHEDALAHVDSAKDALDYVKLDGLHPETAALIRQARTSLVKALEPMLRARGQ